MTFSTSPNGATSVTLSTDLINALTALGVQASGFGDTRIRNGVAQFSITGGAAELGRTRVEILHSGGLTLTAGGTEVNLTDFIISNLNNQAVLTGVLTANGDVVARVPLFNLQVGSVGTSRVRGRDNLELNDVAVTLTDGAAAALNRVFGVTAFTAGFNIGTAQVDAIFNPANGNIRDRQLPIRDFFGDTSLFPGATQDVLPRGKTRVELSDTLVNALDSLNVQASGFQGTRIRNGVANFKITGGVTDLDTTKVDILHAGGLSFKGGDTEVDLTDFEISNLDNQAVLTGAVIVNDRLITRLSLFDLQVGDVTVTNRRRFSNLDLTDVNVTLSADAAGALNQAFGVSAFTAGFEIGTAQVDAFVV